MIAVLGLGGVGGMVAVRTGAVCIGTETTVEAIHRRGLTLVHGSETTLVRPRAAERLEEPVALLVVAVKAPALERALARIDLQAVAGAVVLPLLNGLEHVETLRVALPGATVLAGSIGRLESFSPEPGVVVQRTDGAVVSAASDVLPRERVLDSLAPLQVPGVEVVVGASEAAVLWEKAARMSVLAVATAASGLSVGTLRSDPSWRERLRDALAESCAVARAQGVPLDLAGEWEVVEALPGDLTTSAARDVAAGRASELDAITGAVIRAGLATGVPTPTLERLLAEVEP